MSLALFSGLLSISVVFAGSIEKMVVNLDVNNDGEMINEDVCLDYRENYIRIEAPALEGKTPVIVIHDTTEGVTLYKQAGRCFLLNGDFVYSTDMDHWLTESQEELRMRVEDTVFYNYTAAPFPLDRDYIPSAMQDECDEIYAAILVNTKSGQAAYNQLQYAEGTFVGRLFGPRREENEIGYRNRDRFRKGIGAVLGKMALPFLKTVVTEIGLPLLDDAIEQLFD